MIPLTLSMNTNMMAITAARNLGNIYKKLGNTTQSLSLGLRITKAADDPANMAVCELMRSEIASTNQGIRNATDGISMIQTAEGALAIIDEKLIRMKELAEQASTGTYTTIQRTLMNSEYQAMAMEIDRIALATDFNGIKLLDGTMSVTHAGSGVKIHFGTSNADGEDYYYFNAGDVRATSTTGLRIAGDAQNDIWVMGTFNTGPVSSLDGMVYTGSAQGFAYGYNHTGRDDVTESDLNGPSYLAGIYNEESGASLRDLIGSINEGTQSRIKIDLSGSASTLSDSGAVQICLGEEVFIFGDRAAGQIGDRDNFQVSATGTAASALAAAIANSSKNFWSLQDGDSVYVFCKTAGNRDYLQGCDIGVGSAASRSTLGRITWTNVENWMEFDSGATFGLGGERWATAEAVRYGDRYGLKLTGRDVGANYDLRLLDVTDDLNMSGLSQLAGFEPGQFAELQNAADGRWAGAEIRTQSAAQEALDQLSLAIARKDEIRANLGATQTRLENTVTQLTIQRDNLQRSESEISDLDLAETMTEFTKENIITQAAVAMLAQSNNNAQLALSLIL